ncbi:hypothetical protein BB559_003636 [Furculomyces boomerangus]|uniref:Uncharacterized protein n=2 Tax=Harpellales TaxID=61421 RepID=A0A2T9Y261_9FUNG|nr:hypothetical protein BB559_006517 [Furculomyces boomerangus]PVU92680.1 hypothetical protein BB559_003636 [Furculomyces boomerangus]PWA01135.1 hypothetical protein BB558_002788 [Smittium angustum]
MGTSQSRSDRNSYKQGTSIDSNEMDTKSHESKIKQKLDRFYLFNTSRFAFNTNGLISSNFKFVKDSNGNLVDFYDDKGLTHNGLVLASICLDWDLLKKLGFNWLKKNIIPCPVSKKSIETVKKLSTNTFYKNEIKVDYVIGVINIKSNGNMMWNIYPWKSDGLYHEDGFSAIIGISCNGDSKNVIHGKEPQEGVTVAIA